MHRTRPLLAAVIVGVLASTTMADAEGYDDEAYRQHDLDNMQRTTGRQADQLTDPAHLQQLASAGAETELANLGTQVADLPRGRLYLGLGQLLPGGAVGRAEEYHAMEPVEINFLSRTGAKLNGRLFWDGEAGPHPAITITSGSIQGPQSGYWWAAQLLAANGYVVMTWDTQGQGESETFGHEPGDPVPTGDGVPSQQAPNFVDSTVDAIRFLFSTPAAPYGPEGWTASEVATAGTATEGSGEAIDWHNPLHGVTDRTNLGLIGHSLGASAVSTIAQCSDRAERWREVEACPDAPLPIRAVVGWDRLSVGPDTVPVVPGMNQQADGYFLNTQPELEPPDPRVNLATHDAYVAAGVDTYSVTVRAGTHAEWSYIPLIIPATSYGIDTAGYYTLAWMDRYVHPDGERQRIAADALRTGPIPDGATLGADEWAWRANFLSARRLSAFRFHGPARRAGPISLTAQAPLYEATDLRAFAGLSPVGDWAGANADAMPARPGA